MTDPRTIEVEAASLDEARIALAEQGYRVVNVRRTVHAGLRRDCDSTPLPWFRLCDTGTRDTSMEADALLALPPATHQGFHCLSVFAGEGQFAVFYERFPQRQCGFKGEVHERERLPQLLADFHTGTIAHKETRTRTTGQETATEICHQNTKPT